MKMKAPEDLCSISVGGEELVVDKEGMVEVSSAATVEQLKAHGFTEVKGEGARPKLAGKAKSKEETKDGDK